MAIRFGTFGNDNLDGTDGQDILAGLWGDDRLAGGAGRDLLLGGLGNDTYVIDASDVLVEFSKGGIDTVVADFSHALGANFENLTLAGTADINATGNDADNVILGNAGSNVLHGGAGNDYLDSGYRDGFVFGEDQVFGEAGDDRMLLDTDNLNGVVDSSLVRYDGGEGFDTLVFGDLRDQSVDFASTSVYQITSIEALDLSGAGNHAVRLYPGYIELLSPETKTVRIDGDAGDRVGTTPDNDWLRVEDISIGDQDYAQFTAAGTTIQVDQDIDFSGIASPNPDGGSFADPWLNL